MHHARRILAALCVFFCFNALAAEAVVEDRLPAVKRMLVAMRVGEIFIDSAKKKIAEGIKANPALADDLTWMLGQLTPAEAVDRIAPIYADYLTAAQAEELRTFFSSPAGQKFWRMMMDQISAGKPPLPPVLSWEERQAFDSLAASEAWRALSGSIRVINSRLETMSTRWGEQLMQQRYAGLARELADTLEGSSAPKGSGSAGQGLMPAYFALIQKFSTRNAEVRDRLTAKMREIDLGTVLKPSSLTSRDGIEDGRRKLQLFEAEYSKSQREVNRLNDEFTASLRTLPGPDNLREGLIQRGEKSIAAAYERSMRMEENQRRMIAIMRKILDLADERFGQIRLQDNRLIFDQVVDLRLYESLLQQLAVEAKIEAEIDREQAAVRENAVKILRDVGAKPAGTPGNPQSGEPAATLPIASQQPGPAAVNPAQSGKAPPPPISGPTPEQLQAEIERHIEEYTKPKRKFVTGRKAGEYQAYVTACLERIAQVANRNYPEAARGKLYGKAVVSLSILSSGKLEKAEINRSSGHKILDDAVLEAIRLAAPYPPFPKEFADKTDVLSITEAFSFEKNSSGDKAATP